MAEGWAIAELAKAHIPVGQADRFASLLRQHFTGPTMHAEGISSNGYVVLYRAEYREFLHTGQPPRREVVVPSPVSPVLAGNRVLQATYKCGCVLEGPKVERTCPEHGKPLDKIKAVPKPEKAVEVQVGVMTATVEAGEDGELGTEDDKVKITPRTKKWDYEDTAEGGFKCLHCGKVYKPNPRAEEYVQKHVEREHREED